MTWYIFDWISHGTPNDISRYISAWESDCGHINMDQNDDFFFPINAFSKFLLAENISVGLFSFALNCIDSGTYILRTMWEQP